MNAVIAPPSLREVLMTGLADAMSHRESYYENCGDCKRSPAEVCRDHVADSFRVRDYRLARELVEATSDTGELLSLLARAEGELT